VPGVAASLPPHPPSDSLFLVPAEHFVELGSQAAPIHHYGGSVLLRIPHPGLLEPEVTSRLKRIEGVDQVSYRGWSQTFSRITPSQLERLEDSYYLLALAGPFYPRGLSRAGITGGERRLPGKRAGRKAVMTWSSFPHLAHMFKDARIFIRDASQWSQMLLLLALIVLYLFNVKAIGADNVYMKNFISFLNIGLAGFVLSAIGARFIFSSVSMEGGAFWIIRSSPEKKWVYLAAKFLIHFVPLFLLGEVLIIASNIILSADRYLMILSSVTIFFICVGLVGLGIGLGALFPRFRYVSTAQIATSWGGVLYMIISLLYIGAVVTLEARPVWRHFWRLLTGRGGAVWDIRMAYLAVALLTALVALVPLILGGRHLEEMGL